MQKFNRLTQGQQERFGSYFEDSDFVWQVNQDQSVFCAKVGGLYKLTIERTREVKGDNPPQFSAHLTTPQNATVGFRNGFTSLTAARCYAEGLLAGYLRGLEIFATK